MQVQTITYAISDPLLTPCVMKSIGGSLPYLSSGRIEAAGVGHFEGADPLVARFRSPGITDVTKMMLGLQSRIVVAATMLQESRTGIAAHDLQPYRYRNWLFTMSGWSPRFDREGELQLAIPTYIERNIKGSTVSEALFHQFLGFLHTQGLLAGERIDVGPLRTALKSALTMRSWFGKGGWNHSLSVSDGRIVLGATLGRPVYLRRIEGLSSCSGCGGDIDGNPLSHDHVRGFVLLDTESLPSSEWETVAANRLFRVDGNLNFETFALKV